MAANSDPYSSLYEKLELSHPLVQRFAVSTIFERLKCSTSPTGLASPLGQEALTRCLTSTQSAVIDQTVKEICKLCVEGAVPVERGLKDLQAALDSVNSESVASVVNGIGFLCRMFLQKVRKGTVFMGRSGDLLGVGFHPLVQSFLSRTEGRQHVLQQVGILLEKSSSQQQTTVLEFLQPFITFILLQPTTPSSQVLFARSLHSHLSLLTLSYHCHGYLLLKMLINYIQFYPMETAQDHEVAMAAIKDLVDVWETLSKQLSVHPLKIKELGGLGTQLLYMLIGFCHELLSRKVSFYEALLLIKRVIKAIHVLSPAVSDSVGVNMISIAHMLAMVDLEQEQLLLLELGLGWLEDIYAEEKKCGSGTRSAGPVALVWAFPALHVMSYPSVAVKLLAMRLLQALERVAGLSLTQENKVRFFEVNFISMEIGSWGEQHLAVVLCRVLNLVCSEEETAVNWVSGLTVCSNAKGSSGEQWLRNLTAYLSKYILRTGIMNQDSHSPRLSKGMIVSLSTMVTVFLLDPNIKVALAAAEALAAIGKVEPIWSMSLLPVVLFCIRFRGGFECLMASEVQLGLLKVFPSLASHSTTLPLVLQALQPMLNTQSDVVKATTIRILCQTWECTDRAFPQLQKLLRPGDINENLGQTELPRSRAACIRDVSRKDPDRGVDLVLSVQACIESTDPVVLSLGLQSLAVLCKEDVIDFYTAWLIISKLFPALPTEPLVLQSLCMLLRFGALDAAAHPEAATGVLDILWETAKRKGHFEVEDVFVGARAMAIEGLSFYEVDDLKTLCPNQKGQEVELLFSETSAVVFPFLEELVTKALAYEHRERQRGQKEVKSGISKLGKLLKTFPGALNTTGFGPAPGKIITSISAFPGAALLCFSLPAPEKTEKVSKKEFQKFVKIWLTNHEKIFQESAEKLPLGGNLVVAMLALQSWCSFVSRWHNTIFATYEVENPNIGHEENLQRAAKSLLMIIQKGCEEGIPRVAESATLALAALCKVMPTQAHGISDEVSVFLESRLLQEGHEHMQWSATLALGVVATCLHATDWNRKFNIVQLLLRHAGTSDRGIVRGSCGLALGIICQSLLRGEGISQSAGVSKQRETQLVVQIILSLIQLISDACPLARLALRKLLGLMRTEVIAKERLTEGYVLPPEGSQMEEENFWAVVGLVWGLGSCVTGLEQLQCPTLVSALTDLMISWVSMFSIEHRDNDVSKCRKEWDVTEFFLAAGACLALSTCVEVSARLEILSEGVNVLLERVFSLIVGVTDPNNLARIEQWPSPLPAALYIGAGNLLATVLKHGAQSVKLEFIQNLLKSMQAGAKNADLGTWAQLGAMIGIANSLGAGAALLVPSKRGQQLEELFMISTVQVGVAEESILSRPLLHESACEQYISSVIKALLGVVHNEQDSRLRSYAGWALAFIHNGFHGDGDLEGRHVNIFGEVKEVISSGQARPLPRQSGYHMRGLQDYPEESPLRLLCSMLMSYEQMDLNSSSILPQTTASVLRCLGKAPRLPALDWAGLARRLLKQNQPSGEGTEEEYRIGSYTLREFKLTAIQKEVRQQCVLFAVAHAEQIPALALFLDELSELSRLGTLEPSLRNLLMLNGFSLQRIFSPLRMKQLLADVQEFALNPTGSASFLLEDKKEGEYQRSSFRVSLWIGLASFFEDPDFRERQETDEMTSCVEKCMNVLINLLPTWIWSHSATSAEEVGEPSQFAEEWSSAVSTLAKTRRTWLLHALGVHVSDLPETKEETNSILRAVFARCQLVASECLPTSELKICCRWLMHHTSCDVSRLLVEIALAMKEASLEDKREWLLDSLDTALISSFPTTAILLTALLTSSWSNTGPLSPLDPVCAILDLPLSLPSLLSQDGWASIANSITSKLMLLFDKLGNFLSSPANENQIWEEVSFLDSSISRHQLFSVITRTCIGLKQYLTSESRLKLANSSLTRIRAEA